MKTVRLHRFLALGLLGAALLASCGKEDPQTPRGPVYTGDRLVSISPTLADENWLPVKADYDPIDNTLLQSKGFGVYAYYTGTEDYSAAKDSSAYNRFGLVYNNREFYYDGGTWKYYGKDEFWPSTAGEKLSFFAYAPYDTWHDKVTYDGKVNTIKYDNFVAQSLSETELQKQRDILWGTNTSGLPHKNVWADQYATPGTVDMHFRHAVAKVRFLVQGSLPGETVSVISTGTPTNISTGTSAQTDGETFDRTETTYSWVRYTDNSWSSNYNYWRCTVTETQRQGNPQTQTRTVTQRRDPVYNTEGKRYYIENVSFKGFNKTGTLVLDNTAAYEPAWKDVTRFSGTDPEYVLSSANVLTDSLQYVSAGTISSEFSKYTGVTETPSDLMDGYFLYAVPRFITGDDNIEVKLKYHIANVDATVNRVETRSAQQTRSRDYSRTTILAMKQYPNIMKALHLPVQSGSDDVLRRMARGYTAEQYKALFDDMKNEMPEIAFTTDIIVGFPNETDEDFQQTLDLVDYCRYDAAYTFVYSPRSGTPAARMEDSIPAEVKRKRLQILNEKIAHYANLANQPYLGQTVKVLCEGPSKKNDKVYTGYSEKNKLVNFTGPDGLAGKIVDVKIKEVHSFSLDGQAL